MSHIHCSSSLVYCVALWLFTSGIIKMKHYLCVNDGSVFDKVSELLINFCESWSRTL